MTAPTARSRVARFAPVAAIVALAAVVGCQNGAPSILGYRLGAAAMYDTNIKTVYVPMFVNKVFQTTPSRRLEAEITKALVREIGKTTPFKVVSDPTRADTELQGVIVNITKNVLNKNQQNATRQAELVVSVDVVWRDLRDGRILNSPRKVTAPGTGAVVIGPPPPPVPFDPDVPLPPPAGEDQTVTPTRITATGRIIDELGETNASAQFSVANDIAIRIVALMEKPW